MQTVTIAANELNVLLENILLYTDKKNIHLREVLFVVGDDDIQLFSSDSFVTITDSLRFLEPIQSPDREFALSIEDVEGMLEYVKKDKKVVHKSEIKIKFKNTLLTMEDSDFEGSFRANYLRPTWEKWDILLDLLSEEQDLMPIDYFLVNPDRVAKLARLKADKEAPVVFRGVDIGGRLCLQFKKGTTIKGAVVPVDKTHVKEEFLWNKNPEDTEASRSLPDTESAPNSTD